MPIFAFRAENKSGQVVSGRVEADTLDTAGNILVEKELRILSIDEERTHLIDKEVSVFHTIALKDIVIFIRELSTLISANVALVRSLRSIVGQTSNQRLKLIISDVADNVDGGESLSQALSKYPKIFDEYFVSIIRAGESSGKLDETLEYLADQSEKEYDLMSRFKGMMVYPIFILVALIGVAVMTITFVLPNLTDIFKETSAELPLSTKILIGMSDFFLTSWLYIVLAVVILVITIILFNRTEVGKKYIDLLKLKIPIFGTLIQKIYLVRFTQGLETLVKGGVGLVYGLKIISTITNNVNFKQVILSAAKSVEDGNRLSDSLKDNSIIPPLVYHMIDVGETSGRLDLILGKIAKFYQREADSMINNMLALLEPIIIVVLGIGVGFILIAVVVPLYNISSQL